MTKLSEKFEPLDVIALVVIVSCIVARLIVNDQMFEKIMNIVIGFYFGNKVNKPTSTGGSNKTGVIPIILILLIFCV